MDKEILAQLTAAGAKLGKAEVQLEASQAQVTELTASNETLTAGNATLTTERDTATARVTELEAQLTEAPKDSIAEVALVAAFIDAQLDAAIVASGKTDVDKGAMDMAARLSFINDAGKTLHQLVAAGESRTNDKENNGKVELSGVNRAFLKSNAR